VSELRAAIHVDQLFFAVPGGIGTYVRELVPALASRDPALGLTLFHSRFETPELPERWMREHPIEQLPASIRSLYPRWDLTRRPLLPSSLASANVVHATNHGAVPPTRRGQALVVTVHDLAFVHAPDLFSRRWRWLYRAGLRAAVRHADAIVTPSRSTAEDVVSHTGVDPAKLHVVPLAAALPSGALDAADVATRLMISRPYALFVGTLEPRKNLVRLVRAYRRAAGRGLPHALVLAGPMGWQHEPLMRELALSGPGEIVMTGRVSADELDALYRGADAFVYPSLYEGFGLPVVEAMARGVPTITSATSSLPEVAGDAAELVDPRSVRELTDALERVLTDTAHADSLAARGRAQAERFSWDETARLTLEVYDAVSGRKS
jgi:glycosyltransferase involved in cell wall biosynthesis